MPYRQEMDSFLPSAWLHVRSSFIRQSRNLKPSAQKLQALVARLREILAATEDADIKSSLAAAAGARGTHSRQAEERGSQGP